MRQIYGRLRMYNVFGNRMLQRMVWMMPPGAFRRSFRKYLVNSERSLAKEGLQNKVSPCDPCSYFARREDGRAVGASTTRIGGVLKCGQRDVLSRTQTCLVARFGGLVLRESPFAPVVMERPQANESSASSTQENFSPKFVPLETSPALWAARRQLISPDDVLRCQCKLGELR